MVTYNTELLTGTNDGKSIKVAATATPGTLVHTANSQALDEIYLWAVNNDTTDRILTIEFGGVVSPDNVVKAVVPTQDGLHIIIPGLILTNGNTVRAFADVANEVMLYGYVNRITP